MFFADTQQEGGVNKKDLFEGEQEATGRGS